MKLNCGALRGVLGMDYVYANKLVNSMLIYNFLKSEEKESSDNTKTWVTVQLLGSGPCAFVPSGHALFDPLWKGPDWFLVSGVEDSLAKVGAVSHLVLSHYSALKLGTGLSPAA